MEEKEYIRKSVPVPTKWHKELLDFLGIEEEKYLSWLLFPHENNGMLGFRYNEDGIKEFVRKIYHPTNEELEQDDAYEKKVLELGCDKLTIWKQAMLTYPLYNFVHGKWAIDPLRMGKMLVNMLKISRELNVPFNSIEVSKEYCKRFKTGFSPTDAFAVINPIFLAWDEHVPINQPPIMPD